MKQWVYISLMLLSTVFLLSCKDDELENVNVEDRMPELTLKFTEAEISRTSLNSSEPLQHVENVKLYIYQMDGTVADFEQRIQDATLYATETLPWKNQSTSSGVPMSYKIQTPLEPDGEYVFLAVGTDAESEENYEFPDNGTKFSASVATLKDGKTIQDMAKSEFFSGYQVAKLCSPDADSKSILAPLKKNDAGKYSYDDTADQTTVELTRAVAGVLLYMTDIPAKWYKAGESGEGYRVTKVKLRLHRMPASSVSLCGQSAGTGGSTEAGTEEGPVLIESMDLSELQFPSEGDLYQIVGQKGEVQTLDNTLLYGAYLLPVASEPGKATFTLELWGKACDAVGTIKTNAIENKLDAFECFLEEATTPSFSDFAIERNHVYCIGQKPVADDTEGDAPVSLAGKEIVVDVQDWTPISNDIEFPNLDVNASFVTDFDPGYRFNCINNEFKINIKCLSSNGWKLVIPKDCNWLYVNNNGYWQSSYEQPALEEGSENGNTLSLFMKDFAEKRSYKNVDDINNDVRSVKLELQTLDSEGNIVGNPKYLTIEQYNAIYLEIREDRIGDDVYYCRGFSRLDVGDSFKKKNPGDGSEWIGVAESTGVGYGWGYWDTPPTSVLPLNGDNYDGKKNMFDLMNTGPWAKDIAMYEAYYMCIDIENGTMAPADIISESGLKRLPNENENFWYLPAMYEMQNFIYFYQSSDFIGKVTMDQWYWTMDPTGLYDRVYTARAQKLDSDGYHEDKMDRHNEYFSRPCINLGDYEE